jgi:hypothetical protein
MADASLQIGNGNWAVKTSLLLGYNVVSNRYNPIEIGVTRETTGSRTNQAGIIDYKDNNIARINYEGGVGSLLLEPQRTNLNLYSNNLENAYWTLFQATRTINSAVSPDGTTNAIKLTEDTTTNFHSIYLPTSITVTSGQTYSRSVYLKQSGRMWASLVITDNAITSRAWFDLQNGVVGTVNIGLTAQITNVGNGWYRCTITKTAVLTSFSSLAIEMAISNGVSSYLGNGTSGVFIFGAQLEKGAYPTSYIPTTTTALTRNADLITRNNIYTNNYITSAGGTWFIEINNNMPLIRDNSGSEMYIGESNTSSISSGSKSISVRNNGGGAASLWIDYWDGSVLNSLYNIAAPTAKIAINFNGTTLDAFVNGVKVITNSSVPITLANFQYFNFLSGVTRYIKSTYLFSTPLTDTECIALTQ